MGEGRHPVNANAPDSAWKEIAIDTPTATSIAPLENGKVRLQAPLQRRRCLSWTLPGHDGHVSDDTSSAESPTPRVPRFNPADPGRPEMNRLQRSFFNRVFRPAVLLGESANVDGQHGYAEVMLYELLDTRAAQPADAMRHLRNLVEGLLMYLQLAPHIGHPRVTPVQVLRWSEYSLTGHGYADMDTVLSELQRRLDEFHETHEMSLVFDFWKRVTDEDRDVEVIASSVEDLVLHWFTGPGIRSRLVRGRTEPRPNSHVPSAFESFPEFQTPIAWPAPWAPPRAELAILVAYLRQLLRDAENAARDLARIPRVGEGWVSEMTLLREIQAAFPNERVQHQYRSGWLAPQSLDIFLPDHDIGIEYQGVQHTKPVEFFGGAEAFERQQDRDWLKRSLCESNGCALIEVHPGYDLEALVLAIREEIRGKS